MIEVYTDGACRMPIRVGGWAWVVMAGGEVLHAESGWAVDTTNNRMELTAILEVLRTIPQPSDLAIYSDSQYAIGVVQGGWKAKENQGLVALCRHHLRQHQGVRLEWVRGHDGNEEADRLANEAMDEAARIVTPYVQRQMRLRV